MLAHQLFNYMDLATDLAMDCVYIPIIIILQVICNDYIQQASKAACIIQWHCNLIIYILSNFPHVVLLKVKYKHDAYYNVLCMLHTCTRTGTHRHAYVRRYMAGTVRSRWRNCDSQFHKDINLYTSIAKERSWLRHDLSLTLCSVYTRNNWWLWDCGAFIYNRLCRMEWWFHHRIHHIIVVLANVHIIIHTLHIKVITA